MELMAVTEMTKLGPTARGTLYIQLSNFPTHYLVLVITDEEFRYALITAKVLTESMYANMVMEDIAWLDFRRIHGEDIIITARQDLSDPRLGMKRQRDVADDSGRKTGRGEANPVGCVIHCSFPIYLLM
jgi:mediator of RNA polymerase II transcription subunit 14